LPLPFTDLSRALSSRLLSLPGERIQNANELRTARLERAWQRKGPSEVGSQHCPDKDIELG
jgi:hypothetical protein